MRLTHRHLERVFKAAVMSAVALHCDDDAAVPDASVSDASGDAVAKDAFAFVPDASFEFCDAGPPTVVDACGSCCQITAVHCPIPPGDYIGDSSALYFCDRYCVGGSWTGCLVLEAGAEDAAASVMCTCTGRRFAGYRARRSSPTIGGWFANMARLEGAAVFAFRRLHDELEALHAPSTLLARVRRAIADEERHARAMGRVAKRFGARVAAVREPRFRERTLERMAIENATEGCVRELYGALLATWQAHHVEDASTRRALRTIARDETRHAAISLAVASFLYGRLEPQARSRVEHARSRAVATLRREIAQSPSRDLARATGLPNATQAAALFDAIFSAASAAA